METGADPGGRKERRRAEVRARLRRALQGLAADRPFRDIKVGDITAEAGLSRSAFYFYYDDKRDLLVELVKDITDPALGRTISPLGDAGDPSQLVRDGLGANAAAWERHGDVLHLVVEASIYDANVGVFWSGVIQEFVAAVAERLRDEQERGLIPSELDSGLSAEILVTASVGFFYHRIGPGMMTADQAVRALEPIWIRSLYS